MSADSLFDSIQITTVLKRAKKYLTKDSFIQKDIEENIFDRLRNFLKFKPKTIAIVGLYTNAFKENIQYLYPKAHIEFLPATESVFSSLKEGHFDLFIVTNFLHHVNDIPGVLHLIQKATKTEGLFLASFFGENTLNELEKILWKVEESLYGKVWLHTMPKIDIKTMGMLLQRANFLNPVVDLENYTIEYDDLLNIAADIRTLGLSSTLVKRSKKPIPKKVFQMVEKTIKSSIFLTYDVLYATGYKL